MATEPLKEIVATPPDDLPALAISDKARELVHKTEDIGNAMYATAQEFMLVIEDALVRHHGWTEADIKKLHTEIKPVLEGVAEYERAGLNLAGSKYSLDIVSDIVHSRLAKETAFRKGEDLPILPKAKPFLKALKKKNDQ